MGPPPPPAAPKVQAMPSAPPPKALLQSIQGGARLKKTQTNDRSAPIVEPPKNTNNSTTSGSMSIPSSRSSAMGGVGGLFAAGIPKLNKPGGHTAQASTPQMGIAGLKPTGRHVSQMSEQIPSSISRVSYQAPEPLRKSNENLGSTAMRPLAGRDSQQFGTAGLKPTGPPLPLKKSNEQVAVSSTDQNLATSGLRPVRQRQSLQLGTAGLKPTGPPLPFKKSNENIPQASAVDNTATSGLLPVANRQSFQPVKRNNEPAAQIAPQPAPRQNESFSGPPVPQRQSLQPPPRYSQTQPQLPARPDAAPPARGHVRESSGLAPPVAPRKSPAPVRADQSFSQVTPIGGHLSNTSNTSLATSGKRIADGRFSFPLDIPIPRQYPSGIAPSAGTATVRLRDAPPPPPLSRR